MRAAWHDTQEQVSSPVLSICSPEDAGFCLDCDEVSIVTAPLLWLDKYLQGFLKERGPARILFKYIQPSLSGNTKHLYNIYTMLDQRQRRWADNV